MLVLIPAGAMGSVLCEGNYAGCNPAVAILACSNLRFSLDPCQGALTGSDGSECSPPRDFAGVAAYVDRPKAHHEEYAPGNMGRLPRSN
jgi:hypothetical protein